ncbi:MAG: hypothetical protein ACJASY_001236 [Halioglobus sp.]|jgi:hypothetical protein
MKNWAAVSKTIQYKAASVLLSFSRAGRMIQAVMAKRDP